MDPSHPHIPTIQTPDDREAPDRAKTPPPPRTNPDNPGVTAQVKGTPVKFSSTSAVSSSLGPGAPHLRKEENIKLIKDEMRNANGVGFDLLFEEFFRKVMKALALSETIFNTVFDKVQTIIKAVSQDPRASNALKQ
ncbi:hypothetical protein P691DRAFT_769709 [Macrolepiota fuliginosa MF-IS2]|uniref:Uncharacterized protein n=1 Tax=Macrolepiota fuliginosa MF-IS2 TaxID=1400762 RepID=A0A9P5WWD7_9AGAR|nr:hypothetical protein P691DRAFT_769709 [Macrolepiota fuliginosa MF-IS2]